MKKKAFSVLSSVAILSTLLTPNAAETAAASTTIPVILVPGIGGSQLWGISNDYNGDSGNGTDVVWVDKVSDYGWDLLVDDEEVVYNLALKHVTGGQVSDVAPLHSDARVWPIKDNYGLKGISYLDADQWDISSYYNHMIDMMYSRGYIAGKTLFGLPYDWRQDYAKEFDNITATINQALAASGQSKVAIVAHSQGGLLLKSYLIAHPEMNAKIDRLITLGTPFLGAALAARATSSKLGGYNLTLPVLDNSTGYEISKTAPAVYHLAPSMEYEKLMFQKYGRATINSYNSPSYIPTNPTQGYSQLKTFESDKGLFDWSTNRHAAWDNTFPSVKRYHIVGDSVSTEVAYDYDYDWFWGDEVDYVMKAGDGTVPLISGQKPGLSGAPIYYVHSGASGEAVDHMNLVKDDNVITKVLDLLGDGTVAIPGIDTTPNTSLDGTTFTAYALSGAPEEFDMEVVLTNQDTGAQETYKVKNGKYVSEGTDTGVAVRTMELEDGKFDLQFLAPTNANVGIEVLNNKGSELQFRTYETGKAVSKKSHYGLLKNAGQEKLQIKQNKGKSEVMKGTQKIK
ncbi:MAG: alpha/beta fold hydrolase [Tumebacillaceae bacterium]